MKRIVFYPVFVYEKVQNFKKIGVIPLLKPTLEQEAIVDANFKDILLVNAYAGTGKTSTLIQFAQARPKEKILVLTYNRSMKEEGERKFAHLPYVTVKTIHSLAYGAIGKNYKERFGKLRAYDLMDFLDDIIKSIRYKSASLLLSYIREFANSAYDIETYKKIKYNEVERIEELDLIPAHYLLSKLPEIWEIILKDPSFPFEHDFYLKLYQLSKPTLPYSIIMVDEAQDISGVMMDIVLSQKNAKKVFIGDKYQQIYSWRGAINSLETLSTINGVKTLYLSHSFRCRHEIAKKANPYLQLLNAAVPFKGVKKGIQSETKGPLAVIARTNARLFDYAVDEMEKNPSVKFHFVGGINSYNFQDLIDIQNLILQRRELIYDKFLKNFESFSKLAEYAYEANEIDLETKIEIVKNHINKNISKLVTELESRNTSQQDATVILTTGHKSKGLEWSRVKILDDFANLRRMLEEKRKTLKKEEINLIYVAITRAKEELEIEKDYIINVFTVEKVKRNIFFVQE
jgi:superfamily I DNA/RNA helicase